MAKITALGWGSKGTNKLEGIETSPGKSSKPSTAKPRSDEPRKQAESPKPAQKTVRPSSPTAKASSAAPSAAGGTGKDKGK